MFHSGSNYYTVFLCAIIEHILNFCVFAITDAYIKKKHDQVYAIFLVEQVQLALDYVPLPCFNIYRHSP